MTSSRTAIAIKADDRLEPLAVALQRVQQRRRQHERDDADAEPGERAEQHRPALAAVGAEQAGRDRGEDQHRLEALAEDDDRRVGDDRRLRGGVAERRRDVGQLVVEHRARGPDLAPRRAARDEVGEPLMAERAEPDQALDLGGQRGVERLPAALGPELEDRVELHQGLLGLAGAAGGHLLLEPVERDLDQVEVALVGLLLPGVGIERGQALADRLGPRLDVAGQMHRAKGVPGRRAGAGPARPAAHRRRRPRPGRCARACRAGRRRQHGRRSENATPSWISNATVTRVPSTPAPYSTGISERNLASWLARRASSSRANGAR